MGLAECGNVGRGRYPEQAPTVGHVLEVIVTVSALIRRVAAVAAGVALAVGGVLAPTQARADVYTEEGTHEVNGRLWNTRCEPYSVTERCRTEIWGTTVTYANGRFRVDNGWQFNNLTYKASPRSVWKGNPLGGNGQVGFDDYWTGADGRAWRTECDTPTTGRGGCRSYVRASVIAKTPAGYQWQTKWILNNMVRFGTSKPSTPPPPPATKTLKDNIAAIPDPALRACVANSLANVTTNPTGPFGPWDLNCPDAGVKSLAGLGVFPTLRGIVVSSNDLTDLSTLPAMPGLAWIGLGQNELTSIAGIERAPKLASVNLRGNHLTDIAPLAKLPDLKGLWLDGNEITDVSVLRGMGNLRQLGVSTNPIEDLTPVWGLGLTQLLVDGLGVADLSVLEHMTALRSLSVTGSGITDLAPLRALTSLEELVIFGNPVSDLEPIAELPLSRLGIGNTEVTSVAPLAEMTSLRVLDITGIRGKIVDLEILDPLVEAGLEIYPKP